MLEVDGLIPLALSNYLLIDVFKQIIGFGHEL